MALTKTVPVRKCYSDMNAQAYEFVDACFKNDTLRNAVLAVRSSADSSREWCHNSGCSFRPIVSDDFIAMWFSSADGGDSLTPRHPQEFHGGKSWNNKDTRSVARFAFRALESFGVIRDVFVGESYLTAECSVIPMTHEGAAMIVKRLIGMGLSGERVVTHEVWRWLGWCREDVDYALFTAHQYNIVSYYVSGSVVNIGMVA